MENLKQKLKNPPIKETVIGIGINNYLGRDLHSNKLFKKIIYSNTLDYSKDKKREAYLQLLDIQTEAKQAGEYELSDSVINNAAKILELVIKENIEIPHFSSNPAQQIGFTWNTETRIIFLTVDEIGKLILTIMDLASQNNYLSSQCYMEDINDIITRVKNAL
jgi:hypothetical protein